MKVLKNALVVMTVTTVYGMGVVLAGWESYVPRTIASVIEANRAAISADVTFTADSFPTRATMVYQGQTRPISASRLKFLAEYLGKVRRHPEWVSHYSEEILCREVDNEYWLPIQAGVLAYFKKEVAQGATVELFVTWLGTQKGGDQVDWVFSINEFQVPQGASK